MSAPMYRENGASDSASTMGACSMRAPITTESGHNSCRTDVDLGMADVCASEDDVVPSTEVLALGYGLDSLLFVVSLAKGADG
jgi:hypothetical protein